MPASSCWRISSKDMTSTYYYSRKSGLRLEALSNYKTFINIGEERRGTAILIREGLRTENIKRLPSGRGMLIHVQGIYIVTVYAASGVGKRREREDFFVSEVPTFLPTVPMEMILAGDINCVLNNADSTGHNNYSTALWSFVTHSDLHDVWMPTSQRPEYTYYGPQTASRLDRIYVTKDIYGRKTAVEILAPAFTDHHAVKLRIPILTNTLTRGREYWRMNVSYMHEATWNDAFAAQWAIWQAHKRYYPNEVWWWC
jgi:endonuclease/exonuclease/phosphatase family metal-dependent hydrolase